MKYLKYLPILLFFSGIWIYFSCNQKEIIQFQIVKKGSAIKRSIHEAGTKIILSYPCENSIDTVSSFLVLRNHLKQVKIPYSVSGNEMNIHIDAEVVTASGRYYLDIINDQYSTTIYELTIKPRRPDGKLFTILGPKSIHMGGEDLSELLAFPTDEYHNPAGIGLEYKTITSKGSIKDSISNLISTPFFHDKVSIMDETKLILGSTVGGSNSNEKVLVGLSKCPDSIDFSISQLFKIADGRQYFRIESNILNDEYNNLIEDGTYAEIRILDESHNTISKYKAFTINGIVTAMIKNPSNKGRYFLKITVCDLDKMKEIGYFEPLISKLAYKWDEEKNIEIGPLTSTLGQLIPDGIPVTATFSLGKNATTITKLSNDGRVNIDPRDLWLDSNSTKAYIQINGQTFLIHKKA